MRSEMGNNNTTGFREDNTAEEAEGKSLQESVNANDVNGKHRAVPSAKNAQNNNKEEARLDPDDQKESAETDKHSQTSDGKVDDNGSAESERKSLKEPVQANDVRGENGEASAAEMEKDHEKETGLDSHVPMEALGIHSYQPLENTERQQNEVPPHLDIPEAQMKSNEASNEDCKVEPAPMIQELNEHEKSIGSNGEENHQAITKNQLEKQTSCTREKEVMPGSTFIKVSESHDPTPQDFTRMKFDPLEIRESYAKQSVKDSSVSSRGIGGVLRLSPACTNKVNGHQLDTCISDSLDGTIMSGSNIGEEKKREELKGQEMASQNEPSEVAIQVEAGNVATNGLCKTIALPDFPSDVADRSDQSNSLELQPEPSLMANSVNLSVAMSLAEEKCKVIAEEIGFRSAENKQDSDINLFNQHSATESEGCGSNASKPNSLIKENYWNNEKESSVRTYHDPASNGDCQVEEGKVAEARHLLDSCNANQGEASAGHCEEYKRGTMTVPEPRIPQADSNAANRKTNLEKLSKSRHHEEGLAAEHYVEAAQEKTEATSVTREDSEEVERGNHFAFQSPPLDAEAHLPCTPACPFQNEDRQQKIAKAPEDAQGGSEVIMGWKLDNSNEVFVATSSNFQATSLSAENFVTAAELAAETTWKEVSEHVTAVPEKVMEAKSSASTYQSGEQCEKLETAGFATEGYEAQESMGRLSTESIPDNLNIHAQMRKSPSFSLDLRIEARCEGSDQTPLLYEDKTTIETLPSQPEVTLLSPFLYANYGKESAQYEAMPLPVEEKVITLERSDSEKSGTPFLGFLKEDEETAHVLYTPKKQCSNPAAKKAAAKDSLNKEVPTSSHRGKEKHKRRTSLFGSCMCCATVIN